LLPLLLLFLVLWSCIWRESVVRDVFRFDPDPVVVVQLSSSCSMHHMHTNFFFHLLRKTTWVLCFSFM
jgi:hypothetical protein